MAIIYLFLVLPIWNTLLLVINPKLVSLSLSQLRIVYQNLNTNWTWVHCQCHRTGYESSMMNEIVSEFQLKVNYFRWQRSQNDSVWSVCVCACACVIVFFYFIATQKNISVKSLIFIFLLILTSFYPLLSIYKVTHTSWQISSSSTIRRIYIYCCTSHSHFMKVCVPWEYDFGWSITIKK